MVLDGDIIQVKAVSIFFLINGEGLLLKEISKLLVFNLNIILYAL